MGHHFHTIRERVLHYFILASCLCSAALYLKPLGEGKALAAVGRKGKSGNDDLGSSLFANDAKGTKISTVHKIVILGSYPGTGSALLADLLAQDFTDGLVYFEEPFSEQYALTAREEKVIRIS